MVLCNNPRRSAISLSGDEVGSHLGDVGAAVVHAALSTGQPPGDTQQPTGSTPGYRAMRRVSVILHVYTPPTLPNKTERTL